jgi:hypothetical protein
VRFIESKAFFNDFASEDFLTKNIRVRPATSKTNAGDDSPTDLGATSKHFNTSEVGEVVNEEDQKQLKVIRNEIEEQRRIIKHKVSAYF